MTKRQKHLTKRQLAVIEDLIRGDMDEQQLLTKHSLTRRLFRHWMSSDEFTEELLFRMGSAHRQSSFLLARYAPMAAAKLVGLTDSGKGETVRKACLDIIGATAAPAEPSQQNAEGADAASVENTSTLPISDKAASKILRILAEEDKK